ncbi:MAG TPA: hypothetical protein VGP26_10855 [Actinophytocola sp.]|jgi:hypothetical protein|nr:hypothetical protein [Actinophytocola sp.]
MSAGNGWYGWDLDVDLGVRRLVMQPPTMDGSAIEDLITTVGETLVGRV